MLFINSINGRKSFLCKPSLYKSSGRKLEEINKNELSEILSESIKSLSKKSIDDDVLRNEIKIQIRGYLKDKIGLKPLTCVEIVRI